MGLSETKRLNPTSFVVLGLLRWHGGEATPYDLKRALERSVEDFWPVPHTTFYAEPARLAAAGFVTERRESGGRRRRMYGLTAAGEEALDAWLRDTDVPPPQLRDDLMLKLFLGADLVSILAKRAAWHRAKLEELEGYLDDLGDGGACTGRRTSLVAGTTYHRALLEAAEAYLASR